MAKPRLATVTPISRGRTDAQPRPAGERRDALSGKLRVEQRKLAKLFARAVRDQTRRTDAIEDRLDTWKNAITKLGVSGDKRLGAGFLTDRISDLVAADIWRGDDMAARAVEAVPNQIERAGWNVSVTQPPKTNRKGSSARDRREDLAGDVFPPDNVQAQDDSAKELGEAIDAQCEELGVLSVFAEAGRFERGYGGAAILVGVNDGVKDLTRPLELEAIRSVDWLDVLSPIELIPYQWYSTPYAPKYGMPELFWMQRIPVGNVGGSQRIPIHESRLIKFPGVVVSRWQLNEHWSWGDSVLLRMQEVLRDFQITWQAAGLLLQDFAQAIIKIKGLAASFAAGEDGLLAKRAAAFDEGRSIARAGIIDSEEDFKREATPLTGYPEMLDRFAQRLAAAAHMPVTLLMGMSPAGLNATGESDIRGFYDNVDANRNRKWRPRINQLLKMLFAAKEGPAKGREPEKWTIQFNPLWQPTDKEKADTRKTIAEADQIYLQTGALLPEEVAKSRFSGDTWSMETHLDQEIRDAFDKQVEEEAKAAAAQLQAAAAASAGSETSSAVPGAGASGPKPGPAKPGQPAPPAKKGSKPPAPAVGKP